MPPKLVLKAHDVSTEARIPKGSPHGGEWAAGSSPTPAAKPARKARTNERPVEVFRGMTSREYHDWHAKGRIPKGKHSGAGRLAAWAGEVGGQGENDVVVSFLAPAGSMRPGGSGEGHWITAADIPITATHVNVESGTLKSKAEVDAAKAKEMGAREQCLAHLKPGATVRSLSGGNFGGIEIISRRGNALVVRPLWRRPASAEAYRLERAVKVARGDLMHLVEHRKWAEYGNAEAMGYPGPTPTDADFLAAAKVVGELQLQEKAEHERFWKEAETHTERWKASDIPLRFQHGAEVEPAGSREGDPSIRIPTDQWFKAALRKDLAKGMEPRSTATPVIVENVPRTETLWRCPHCNERIPERGGLFRDTAGCWTHRACGGELEFPLAKSILAGHLSPARPRMILRKSLDEGALLRERRRRDARDFSQSLLKKLGQLDEDVDPLEYMFAREVQKSAAGAPEDVLSAAGKVLAYHQHLRRQGADTTERTSQPKLGLKRGAGAGSGPSAQAKAAGDGANGGLTLVVRGQEDDPEGEEGDVETGHFISGRNGVKYPAIYNRKLRRWTPVGADNKPERPEKTRKGLEGWLVYPSLVEAAQQAGLEGASPALLKSLGDHWLSEPLFKRNFSQAEMAALNLRWITVHPNGQDDGVPIIVHDDGTHYTVVGGAGGSMNQMVFQKKTGDQQAKKKDRKAKAEQKAHEIAQVKQDDPDSWEKLEAAEKEYRDAAKAATEDYRNQAAEILGAHIDTLQKDVAKEAEKRAMKELGLDKKPAEEHTAEDKADIQEFVEQAQGKVKEEVDAAIQSIVNQALDAAAKAAINQEAVNADSVDEVKAVISGKQLVKKLTNEEIQQLVEGSARSDQLRIKANAIRRALRSGNAEAVQGIKAALYDAKPTEKELEEWTKNRYLNRESVITHTNLVKGSNLASERTQRNAQAGGASDGLNHLVADLTGEAIVSPEVARKLGVEGTARVAAAYLKSKGVNGKELAGQLGERIAQHSEADAAAALQAVGKLDAIAKSAVDASRGGDGTVTAAQARIVSGNMATQKYRLLNNTRGRLRGAAALAHSLEHTDASAMVIPAGNSKVSAQTRAKELGLAKGTYQVKKAEGGGYALEVPAEHLHTLAKPHSIAEAERNAAMDDLRQEVDDNWQQFTSPHLKASLRKHQVLAVRAITEQKRCLLNYGAGCIHGSTFIHDPVRNETRSVRHWMERGEEFHVWALSSEGQAVIAKASVPFIKAHETMYRVTFSNRREITVAAGHRFKTPAGWDPLRTLAVGALVAVPNGAFGLLKSPGGVLLEEVYRGGHLTPGVSPGAPRSTSARCIPDEPFQSPPGCVPLPPASNLAGVLAVPRAGAPHYDHKPGGARDHYSLSAPRHGEPLPWVGADARGAVPSPADVHAHSPWHLRGDAPAVAAGHSHHDPGSGHLSTLDCPNHAAPQAYGQPVSFAASETGTHCLPLPGVPQQSVYHSILPRSTHGHGALEQAQSSASWTFGDLRPEYTTEWAAVVSITPVAVGDVFDLEVYEHHNYLAHGVWHHNSGKTGVIYGAISELLAGNKVDRVLVTMPAKPRSQQENYVEQSTAADLAHDGHDTPEKIAAAGWKQGKNGDYTREQTGEKFKFLTDDLHGAVTVIKDGADFDRKRAKIESGELKAIIMSPELMRERREHLEKLGFGGDRSAYFADEAHKLSAGEGEGAGSGMAQAAASFSKSEYFAPGTGTSIENNASELHSLLGMVHPDQFPKSGMKKFRAEWERTAAQMTDDGKGGKPSLAGIFAHESMSGLRTRLSGTMLSYHAPVQKSGGGEVKFSREIHHVPLDEGQKKKIRDLNATRDKEMQHEDPKVRKAAPLRWQAGIIRSIIGDGMFTQMADMVRQGRIKDPAFRAVVWASEIEPLLGSKKRKGLKDHMADIGPTSQITGANSDKQTKAALNDFNDRDNKNAALLVSNAGNFGINAQGGNAVFMAGHPLVYSNLDQLEHRVNRTGQDKDVESHIFVGDHPIMKQLLHNVMEGKGKSARLLEVLADDSLVGLSLASNRKALDAAAGASA